MFPSPVPVVLVGCGAVARLFYAPALSELARHWVLKTVAVVDPSSSAREQLGAMLTAKSYAALAEALSVGRGLAILASPPRWHYEQTLAALECGWHVLCEKPMAATSAEAERMIAVARAAGLILAVGHYKRFFPSSHYLKFLCGPTRPLGALRSFSIAEGGPFTWPAASPTFFQRSETPGGVLFDIGVHVFDLLLWWLGTPTEFTYADDAMGGLEANACVSLRFGAIIGRVQLSRDWATAQRYEFEFEHGIVGWTVNDANGLTVTLRGAPGALRGRLHGDDGAPAATNPQSFIAQLKHVATAVRNHTSVLVDGQEGVRALHLIEACYARRQFMHHPWFSPSELANARLRASSS